MFRKAGVLICLIMILALCFASCGGQKSDTSSGEQEDGGAVDKQEQEAEQAFENVDVIKTGGDLVFDITFDEFVKTWNGLCSDEIKVPGRDEWETYTTDRAIHYNSPANNYLYAPGDNDALYPMLHIYTSRDNDKVVQVELSYDDHSMQEYTYNLYEEMCVNSLKCIMQAEDTGDLSGICSEVNASGSDNAVQHGREYGENAIPPLLFHMDGAGVYLYYELGSRMHFCIIPVDKKRLSDFQEVGTEIERTAA